jgi:hypothetical protein
VPNNFVLDFSNEREQDDSLTPQCFDKIRFVTLAESCLDYVSNRGVIFRPFLSDAHWQPRWCRVSEIS